MEKMLKLFDLRATRNHKRKKKERNKPIEELLTKNSDLGSSRNLSKRIAGCAAVSAGVALSDSLQHQVTARL